MSTPTLRNTMQAAFSSGSAEYSDMVIKDRTGASYHVHRNILCWQSPFFANAMKEGRFKEGAEKAITLPEEAPEVVKAMLDYLYGEDYSENLAGVNYSEDLAGVDDAETVIRFHIDVYVIADKYDIANEGLTKLACKYFIEASQANWDIIPGIISTVYDKTTDRDRILRPALIKFVKRHLADLIDLSDFEEAVSELPGLGFALIKKLNNEIMETTEHLRDNAAQFGVDLKTFCCESCDRHVVLYMKKRMRIGADNRIDCPLCMASFLRSTWMENIVEREV